MTHLSKSTEQPRPEFLLGKEISLSSWRADEIAVDEEGNVYSFIGYRAEDQPGSLAYYKPSVADRYRDGRSSCRFIRLLRGTLIKWWFLSDDRFYRVIPGRKLVLPKATQSYFGVISEDDGEEDAELTRAIFGGTRTEIEHVATGLAHIAGRSHNHALRLPRVTFSKQRDHRCDIAGCWIPREFPYVAFDQASYDWSHLSLHGFYRLMSFLCGAEQSSLARALVEAGVEEEALRRFVLNADGNQEAILSHDDFWESAPRENATPRRGPGHNWTRA